MKTLIVCYSLTGNTRKIAERLAEDIHADLTTLEEIPERSIISAYTKGIFYSLKKNGSNILPIEETISDYDAIVIASPVWASNPVPAIYSFIRQYNLVGKTVYGLLSCKSSDVKDVCKIIREEFQNAGANCKSVITVKVDKDTINAMKTGLLYFSLDNQGKLCLEKSNALLYGSNNLEQTINTKK